MKVNWLLRASVIVISCVVSACSTHKNFAPVTNIRGYEAVPSGGKYRVAAGDTLYSIAWRHGIDYRTLAKRNGIPAPYHIDRGDLIYLRGKKPESLTTATPVTVAKLEAKRIGADKEPSYAIGKWSWPTRGKVVSRFSSKNNGIKIRGFYGDDVLAAAPGKVVYAGNALRGYGNLVIIKHNSQYLSAYALNKRLFVKEGEWVKAGQKIAQIGMDVANRPSLHFEIRRAGEPVNPLNLLKT